MGGTLRPPGPGIFDIQDKITSLTVRSVAPQSNRVQISVPSSWRGVTFPWGEGPPRRHMRQAKDGWSWTNPFGRTTPYADDVRDMFGYLREQIMSSTLFRLYLALGGDALAGAAADPAVRRTAADYVTYLVARGLNALGDAHCVLTPDPATFACAMIEADVGTIFPPKLDEPGIFRTGGSAWKAIEWAFEQQGLAPLNMGADIYIDDRQHGGYGYAPDWHAPPTCLWSQTAPDGTNSDQPLKAGVDNFVFVSVGNRGLARARNVSVALYMANAAHGSTWPNSNHWTRLLLQAGAQPTQDQAAIGSALVFGPFVWHPASAGKRTILAVASCDTDLPNVDPSTLLACGFFPSRLETLTRLDNNLAVRVMTVS